MSSEPSAPPTSQYLRLIFRQVPGAVWATDRSLRFTYLLGGTLKLDVRNLEELVGTTLYEFVRTTDPVEPVIAHHLAALAGTAQSFQYVRGGHSLEVLVEPLRDDEGAVIGCVGAAIDASEHRDVQERLARTEVVSPKPRASRTSAASSGRSPTIASCGRTSSSESTVWQARPGERSTSS